MEVKYTYTMSEYVDSLKRVFGNSFKYRGISYIKFDGCFWVRGEGFDTEQEVKKHIDNHYDTLLLSMNNAVNRLK